MREIQFSLICEKVAQACIDAATNLPNDVLKSLENALDIETSKIAQGFLKQCILNAKIAKDEEMPICQDTGFAVFFVELGEDVKIVGGGLSQAINEGVKIGYDRGFLRKSIVDDPVFLRKNTRDNTPAIIHYDIVPGDQLKIIVAPKGGGSENMSAIKMCKPSEGKNGIIEFVSNSVIKAGGNPCPPVIVGVGIGGTFEKAAYLAKKALLRPLGEVHKNPLFAELEQEILTKINNSKVGAQGLGGDTTALAVHIEDFPCHIASMPVAVNLNCHAARHLEIVL